MNVSNKWQRFLRFTIAGLFIGFLGAWTDSPASAATNPLSDCEAAAAGRAFVCFDHAAGRWIKSIGEIRRAGEPLAVVVIHTDPTHITAIAKPVSPDPKLQSALPACARDGASVDTVFPDGEGRYTLEITVAGCTGLPDVAPTEFRVDILNWEQAVAGAFVGSEHRDPLFSTYTRQVGDQTLTFVDREPEDRENDVRLGLGSFIHLYHEGAVRKLPWLPTGLSFGLGIGEENRTSYSVGLSWRLGDKAFLTGGYSWAPVDRLPTGVRTCARSAESCDPGFALTDPNRIANLDERTEGALFVGLSYTFIELGSFFQDRFKEAIKAGGTSSAGQTPTATSISPADLELKLDKSQYSPGETVKLTAKSKKAPTGNDRLRILVPDFLEVSALNDWEACSGTPSCFELKKEKFTVNKDSTIEFKVKAGAAPGTFSAVLSVGGVSGKALELKIVSTPTPASG
jgi:hypothetical protein